MNQPYLALKCCALALAAGLFLVAVKTRIVRGDDVLQARLQADAPKAWAKVSSWAERLEIDTSQRVEQGSSHGRIDRVCKLSDGNCLIIMSYFKADGTPDRDEVYCRNAKYSFQLRRAGPKLPWLVQRFGRTPNADIEKLFGMLTVEAASKPQLSAGPVYVPSIFGKEQFVIKEVKPERRGSTELVSVTFEYTPPEMERPFRWLSGGTLTFNPDLAWAVQDCNVNVQTPEGRAQHWREENDFASQSTDIPILNARRSTFEVEGQSPATITLKVDELNARKIPEEEFTLTAFGLPEMMPPSSSWTVRVVIALAVIGVLCFIAAFFARRRSAQTA